MLRQQCRCLSARLGSFRRNQLAAKRLYSSSAATAPEVFDVVIVGGGPAGLGLAVALKASRVTSRLKIAVIETQDVDSASAAFRKSLADAYSNRCSSITPASASFLKDIGVWQHLSHQRIQPYTRMHVWDGVSGTPIKFDWAVAQGIPDVMSLFSSESGKAEAYSDRPIAFMTENANLVSAMYSRLNAFSQKSSVPTTILQQTRVESVDLGENTADFDWRSWPIVTLASTATAEPQSNKIAARLLVGADGPNSLVRKFADISSNGWDYERHGVVATVRLDHSGVSSLPSHQLNEQEMARALPITAYQRFLPTGPIALLPLPDNHASLVWSTTPENAAHLKSLTADTDISAMINAGFRLSPVDLKYMHSIPSDQVSELSWRTQHSPIDSSLVPPQVVSVQARSLASFPLRMRHAETYTGERVALVGDAAHTVHPLAGQGLNLGLADVKALAAVLEDSVQSGADIGSTISLEQYNRERYIQNHIMLGVCDKLHKLYSWSSGPVVGLRSLGLGAIERFGALKGLLMNNAEGR